MIRAKDFTWEILRKSYFGLSYYLIATKSTSKSYPSAPLENNEDLKQRLGNKFNVVNTFNNSINNVKEMITYLKIKIVNQKRNIKFIKHNSILESVETVIIGATTKYLTLSVTGVGLIVVPIAAGFGCTLSLVNKVLHRIIINKYNKYNKQY